MKSGIWKSSIREQTPAAAVYDVKSPHILASKGPRTKAKSSLLPHEGNKRSQFDDFILPFVQSKSDRGIQVAKWEGPCCTAGIAGSGTLYITRGSNALSGAMFFAMTGGLIDVSDPGGIIFPISFSGSNGGNDSWASNKSSLNVGEQATFWGNEGHIRVDALSGYGTIRSGYSGLGSFTFGVNNGSDTFGILTNDATSGHIGRYNRRHATRCLQ